MERVVCYDRGVSCPSYLMMTIDIAKEYRVDDCFRQVSKNSRHWCGVKEDGEEEVVVVGEEECV